MRHRTLTIGVLALASLVASAVAGPLALITPDEARLPPPNLVAHRGMTRTVP